MLQILRELDNVRDETVADLDGLRAVIILQELVTRLLDVVERAC
jgi:hypothetical protein